MKDPLYNVHHTLPYFLGGFRLIRIVLKGSNVVLYEEKSLSPDTELPYFIVPGKEDRSLVTEIWDRFEHEVVYCNENTFEIEVDGKTLTVQPNVKPTQLDDKLRGMVTFAGKVFKIVTR